MQKRNVLIHVGIIVILSISVSVAVNLLLLLVDLPKYSTLYQEASEVLYAPPIWQQLLSSGLLVPIVEEVIFRAVVFRILRRWIAFSWSMIISSFLFGVYHGNFVQFVYASVCGVLLAYLYEKYDSVLAAILSHMAMNTAALIMTWAGIFSWIMKHNLKIFAGIFLCGCLGYVLLHILHKKDVTKVLKIYCKDKTNDI